MRDRIALDADSLGLSTKLSKKAKGSSSPAPSASAGAVKSKKDTALLAGLRGQTAAQQTCSIAAG